MPAPDETFRLLQNIEWFIWLKFAVIVISGYFLAKLISVRTSKLLQNRLTKSQQVLLSRGLFGITIFLFLAAGFQQLGFQLTALLSAAGILTVAIGFAAQTSMSNLISGVFLLGEHSIRIGDMIQIDTVIGEVQRVDLFSVKLITPDGILVRIPNELIVKSRINNINRFPNRRLDLTLQVAYGQDLENIEKLLLEAVLQNPLLVQEPAPVMQYTKFTKEGVELLLMSWTYTSDFGKYAHLLVKEINRLFLENQVVMAVSSIAVVNHYSLNKDKTTTL